ncbi:MAG: carboxypeptidase-like regulatory domain-containing protein [Candidatus Kapabacteria bacterium]|nr:carboxypeptidase-like regulatory domain-containing protein [Candidatus Kapabacteria bacterium]
MPILGLLSLSFSGCDILFPPVKVQLGDTTITAPNGSAILYGTVWQTPLDAATLARLRSEGYSGPADKAPLSNAEVIITSANITLRTFSDRLGRYSVVLATVGTYSLSARHYATLTGIPVTINVRTSQVKDISLRPAKEFVFPLALGNKWVFDYEGTGSGITTWEIIKEEKNMSESKYSVLKIFNGVYNSQNYFSRDTFNIMKTSSKIIFNESSSPTTIPRFMPNGLNNDTLTIREGGGTSITMIQYVNNIGRTYYYADGGSPGSGRWSVSFTLRSYTLKP